MNKETASVPVRIYASTHKKLKIMAAKKSISLARLLADLIKGV